MGISDLELVDAIRKGEIIAFQELYKRYADLMYLYFVSYFHLSGRKLLPRLLPAYPPVHHKIPPRYLSGFFYQTVGEKGEF